MGDIIIIGIPVSIFLLALVQLLKKYIANRWIPLVSVFLGALLGVLASLLNGLSGYSILEYGLKGVVLGLSVSGLWDVGKKTIFGK